MKNTTLENNLYLPKTGAQKFKAVILNPYGHFLLFGVLMFIVLLLRMSGLVQYSFVSALGNTMIYSMVALGFCLLLGYSGLASLGTAGFMGLGAYVTAYFVSDLGLPYLLVFAIAAAASILVGVVVGFISLRIEGIYLAIITLGLSEILVNVFKAAESFTGGSSGKGLLGLEFFGIRVSQEMGFVMVTVVLVLLMSLTLNIINSPTGRAMLAMKNSTSAAQAMGISLLKYRLLAFVLATLYAGIGGIMYMTFVQYSKPEIWSIALSLNVLSAIIIGGSRSIWGTLAGTLIIFGINTMFLQNIEFFRTNPNFIYIFTGLLIILVVMFFQGGLAQLFVMLKLFIKKKIRQFKEYRYGEENVE